MSCKRHKGHAYGDADTIGQRKLAPGERCACGTMLACDRCGEHHVKLMLCLLCAVSGPLFGARRAA